MSISSSLLALQTAKTDIASAITARGGTVNAGDGMADYATDILSIAPDPKNVSATDYIKASRPSAWANYSYIDLTGQEVCYLTYDYLHMPDNMVRWLSLSVTCTGNYTLSRGHVTAEGFTADATFTAASNAVTTLLGEDTGVEDYVCYRITGTAILAITYQAYTDANGNIYAPEVQRTCEIYARLPNLTSITGIRNRSVVYETIKDVTLMTTLAYAWYYCASLQSLDLAGWNTANVTTLANAWHYCTSLQSLDLAGWSTASVTTLANAWRNCTSLQSLDLAGWNTANVTTLAGAWQSCTSLQSFDLAGWSTASVTTLAGAWNSCILLYNFAPPANIKFDMSLSDSTNYSASTLVSVIANLYDLTGFTAQTLTIGTTNKEKLTMEQIAVATAKNWTVA